MKRVISMLFFRNYLSLLLISLVCLSAQYKVYADKFISVIEGIPVVGSHKYSSSLSAVVNPDEYGVTLDQSLYNEELLMVNNMAHSAMQNGDVGKLAFLYLAAKSKQSKELDNLILSATLSVVFPLALPVPIYYGLVRNSWVKIGRSIGRYLGAILGEEGFRQIDSIKKFSPFEAGKAINAMAKKGYDTESFKKHINKNHKLWSGRPNILELEQ